MKAEFPPVASSARAARRFVTEALDSSRLEHPELLELFVSEIATNAILHARTPFTVSAEAHRWVVRVSVTDASPLMPSVRSPGKDAITGRGLKMISERADRWGVESKGHGKVVWFELRLVGSTSSRSAT